MSAKAVSLIKQAVKIYLEEDGASKFGSYRDAVTDLLHLADMDLTLQKEQKDDYFRKHYRQSVDGLKEILDDGLEQFQSEKAEEERTAHFKSDDGEKTL